MRDECQNWHSFDNISLPLIRDFADHWNDIRGDKPAPSRVDFHPENAVRFLPHLFLLDVIRPEMRFRARLVGTATVAAIGFDYTGQHLDEVISEPHLSTVERDLRDVAETGVLHYRVTTMAWDDREHAVYHRLYLPFTVNSDRIDMVMGIAKTVDDGDRTARKRPLAAIIESPATRTARIVL